MRKYIYRFVPTVSFLAAILSQSLAQGETPADQKLSEENAKLKKQIEALESQLNKKPNGGVPDVRDQKMTETVREQNENTKRLTSAVSALKEQIETIGKKVESANKELTSTSGNISETDRQKHTDYLNESAAAREEIAGVRKAIEKIAALLGKGEQKGNVAEEVQSLSEKVVQLRAEAARLEAAPQEFKAYTKISAVGYNGSRDLLITLFANKGGKRVPLANRSIRLSRQYLDGDLNVLQTGTTDADGNFIIPMPRWRGMPPGQHLVIEFAGDKQNRPSSFRK